MAENKKPRQYSNNPKDVSRQDLIGVEKALAESEASYRAIFELANDAIVIRDVNTYKIVDANNKACEIFCYHKEEMLGLGLKAIIAVSGRYPFKKLKEFYDKAAGGEPQLFEWVAKDRLGREFWVEVNVKRAIIGGQYRILSIARDITERKQSLEDKDSFMNMISHKLRTPLGAIKESISLLQESKAAFVNEEQKEILDIAKRNVDRLARLINKVLYTQK